MASLTVVFAGPPEQRHTIKATPMTPLSAVLEEACSKMKPALAPGEHALACGKPLKPVDLSLPFRLANIPSGSRLELVRSAAAAPAAAPMARAAPQATAPSHSTGGAAAQAAGASDADAGPSNSGGGAGAAATPEVASAREAPAAPAPAAAAEPAAPHGGEAAMKSVEGLDRQVAVFSRAAVEAAAAASGAPAGANVDVPDDFYEFTQEDFAAVSRAAEARKQRSMVFKTSAAREAEEKARALAFGPVPVRFHLPGDSYLQASFSALDTVGTLYEFVDRALVPELAGRFRLYTTPPRQVLRERDATLYHCQLVPAAHVHLSLEEDKFPELKGYQGPLLRQAVAAAMSAEVPRLTLATAAEAKEEAEATRQPAGSSSAASASAVRAPGGGSAAGGTKVPKWLKLGK